MSDITEDLRKRIIKFKDARDTAEHLSETFHSGEFLLEVLPPEMHLRALEVFAEIREQIHEAEVEAQTQLAQIKMDLKNFAADTFSAKDSGWTKVAIEGFEARPTRKFEYDSTSFIRAAKERKSYEELKRQGVIREVVDEKRLKAVVSEEDRQFYNERALTCSLGNISVYDDKSAERSKY